LLGLQCLVVLLVHVAGIGVENIGDRAVNNGGNLIAPIHQLREDDDVNDGTAKRSQDGPDAAATRYRGQHHAGDEEKIRHRHQHRLQGGATRSKVWKQSVEVVHGTTVRGSAAALCRDSVSCWSALPVAMVAFDLPCARRPQRSSP
jgi:hypothetical protein